MFTRHWLWLGSCSLLLVLGCAPLVAPSDSSTIPTGPTPSYLPLVLKAPGGPTIEACPQLPSDSIWNRRVDTLPVDTNSSTYINTIGADVAFHMDFGSGTWAGFPIGIPYNIVTGTLPRVSVTFQYSTESDIGPYPIPLNPLIEGDPNGNGDRHILMVDRDNCVLYELYAARKVNDQWLAGSGAIFNLRSNTLRPAGWTSADAAGLPILPGLARYDEAASGDIRHALRFTAPETRDTYIWPARHQASDLTGAQYPPMGQRFRLKSTYNINQFSPIARALALAMQRYGIILADNGSPWYVTGTPDERWDNDVLHELDILTGTDFEAVNETGVMIDPNSGQAVQP